MYKILFLTLLLTSCKVGNDYKKPQLFTNVELTSSIKTNGSKTVSTDWYKQYGDNDLNSLIMQSLQSNMDVNIAISKLKQARIALKSSAVNNLPMVNLDASYHYDKLSKNRGLSVDNDYYQNGLDASWEFDIWGKNARLEESNLALYKAASSNIDNVKISLTAEVINNYFGLRQAQELLKINNKNLEIQKNLYRITRDKYKAGLSDDTAYNQSKFLVASSKAQIPPLEQHIVMYQNTLSILAGKLPKDIVLSNNDTLKSNIRMNVNELFEFPIKSIENRPDVKIAEQTLISKNALVGNAISQLYPNVSIGAFFGLQSLKFSDLYNSSSKTYSYAPTFNLPLLNWGQLNDNIDIQKSIKKEYIEVYKSTLLNAVADVKNSYTAIDKEYQANKHLRRALSAQIKVSDTISKKYKIGLIEFSEVLKSQQDLLDIQTKYITSNANIYQNIASFYKALGGGYSNNTKTNHSYLK